LLDSEIVLQLILIFALIALNAFFAASEIAILSIRRLKVRQLADSGDKNALALQRLTDNPGVFLATIQVGITLSGFFASAIGAISAVVLLDNMVRHSPVAAIATNSGPISLVVVTTLVAFVSLLLGELVPKNLAIQQAETIALTVARPLEMVSIGARPAVVALTWITDLILRLMGSKRAAQPTTVTEEELRAMVDLGSKEGVLAPFEKEIIDGAFNLGELRARDIMVPRLDVVALDVSKDVSYALDLFLRYGYSRLPVYERNLDEIVGVISAKDLLGAFTLGGESATIAGLMRPPTVVNETRRLSELLNLLQRNHTQMAVVLDEFGGTAGIVALEDVLEELVGEIAGGAVSQHQSLSTQNASGSSIVDGKSSLAEVNDAFSLHLSDEHAHTIGGYIQDALGRLAIVDDEISTDEVRLRVIAMNGRRILTVQVQNINPIGDELEH
jgi:putative hemolysin